MHSPYLDAVGVRNLDGTIPNGQENIITSNLIRNIQEGDANNPFNHKQDFFLNNYSIMRNAVDKSFAEIKLKPLIISGQ